MKDRSWQPLQRVHYQSNPLNRSYLLAPRKEEVMENERAPLNLPRVELTGSYEIVLASHSAIHAVLVQQSCYGYDGEPSHHFVVRRHGKADFTSDSLFGALAIYNGL